jgi:hypothetical protein
MKMLCSVVLICVLSCAGCASVPGYDTPRFKGEVLDSVTKAPIPNAQVSVAPYWDPESTSKATSDAAGRFDIAKATLHISLSPISFDRAWIDARIEVSAEGYETKQVVLLDLPGRDSPEIPIYLKHR